MTRPRPHDCPWCQCDRDAETYDAGRVDPSAPHHRLVLDVMHAAAERELDDRAAALADFHDQADDPDPERNRS